MRSEHATPIVLDDRELDIQVAEALGYRWYNAHGQCNLVDPVYFDEVIKPSIPVMFQEGKRGEIGITETNGFLWPALPMFSSNLALAMHAADYVGLFESHNPTHDGHHGFVLTRICNDYAEPGQQWMWHVAQVDERGIMQGFVAASTPQFAICQAIIKFVQIQGA